jgi:hypothetical protein
MVGTPPRPPLLPCVLALVTAGACGSRSSVAPSNQGDAGAGSDASTDAGDRGPQLSVPVLPVGMDAFRMWDQWPMQRIGMRAVMRSTYDRTGGNEASDASHFVRETPAYYVPFELEGAGEVRFFRANRWHGSPWHEVVDGADTVVTETNTEDPDHPVANATFLPAAAFPSPLAMTETATAGGDVSWVPMGFTRSYTLGYERTDYGTGYAIAYEYPAQATNLSQPVTAWSAQPPAQDVVDLLAQSGQDIAPGSATGVPDATVTTQTGSVDLAAGTPSTIATLTGPSVLRALTFTVPLGEEQAFGASRIRITWDGRAAPSVDAPVALFFGAGTLFNRAHATYLVEALPVHVRFDAASVELATYFPMPFFRSAQVELLASAAVPGVTWETRTQPYAGPANWASYFHATFVDQGTPTPGQDLLLLDTTQAEGGGNWSGSLVGTAFTFTDRAAYTTLEGDPRFFFDDSQTPQAQGTGTEEWGAGGDYWDGGEVTTLPFAGHPVGAPSLAAAQNATDAISSAYRFLLSDALPFGRNARVQLEHGGVDDSTEHYTTLAFWYGLPGASLEPTDTFHVSDPGDEAAHAYVSPDASSVDTLTSRYEWGVDTVNGAATYPATTDTGRHTTGTSEFTIALDPVNYGVLLRRKLDYGYPDQRAVVSVADDAGGTFVLAGTWYLAGGSTYVFADSTSETTNGASSVETSPHRWRDDEFLVPRQLTEGRSSVRVRIAFSPAGQPLQPGGVLPAQAWSEYRYAAYCWTLPPAPGP